MVLRSRGRGRQPTKKPKPSNKAKKTFAKVLAHPDVDEIIDMLRAGTGVRTIDYHLKEKYPDDKTKHISYHTLHDFRHDKLNIDAQVIDKIKRKERQLELKKRKKMQEKINLQGIQEQDKQVKKQPAYRRAIEEAAKLQLDIRTELSELIVVTKKRIEDLFNRAQVGGLSTNEERNLLSYLPILTNALEKWMKYVEKTPDHTYEANININIVEDQMAVFREVVREVFMELDPSIAPKFLEKLNEKMKNLQNKQESKNSFKNIHKDTMSLSQKFHKIEDAEELEDYE